MAEQKISVIGTGTMGRGIAQVAVQAGYQVLLFDSLGELAKKSFNIIMNNIEKLREKGELEQTEADAINKRICIASDLEEIKNSYFVIEAVTEDRAEKKKLFEKLDALCPGNTILASNTSSIPITDLASETKNPENIIGMHFMNPVPLIPGVEIIRGLKTSDETYKKTLQLAEEFSKKPIYSSDRAGFVINRIIMPLINEAVAIVDEGTSTVIDVDNGAKYCLNHPLGPLALSDLIGNDTTHHILSVLEHELGERFKPVPLLTRMVEAGLYGNKNGAGFYVWEDNKPIQVNKVLLRFLNLE